MEKHMKKDVYTYMCGFPSNSAVKNLPAMQETCRRHGFDSWVGKIPWRRNWPLGPVFLLKNPKDRGAWQDTVPGFTESDMTE